VNDTRQTLVDLLVFSLLVAIGVAGRWGQPEWCFTPTAAAAIFAGRYFNRLWIAALVPMAILAISDTRLSAYDSYGVLIATYAALAFPAVLGKWLGNHRGGWSAAWRWGVCGLVPALVFFVVTNFAVWVFESDYPRTAAGLLACYTAAVPFFRWMLMGDVFYLVVLFGAAALAGVRWTAPSRLQPQPATARENYLKRA